MPPPNVAASLVPGPRGPVPGNTDSTITSQETINQQPSDKQGQYCTKPKVLHNICIGLFGIEMDLSIDSVFCL